MNSPQSLTIGNIYMIDMRSRLPILPLATWAAYTRKFSITSGQSGTNHRIYNGDRKDRFLTFLECRKTTNVSKQQYPEKPLTKDLSKFPLEPFLSRKKS